jgi:hypothetical protein
LTEFRASWGNGEVTTHRKPERMVSLFSFCVRNELLRKNPMEALKKPKTPDIVPTDYFLPCWVQSDLPPVFLPVVTRETPDQHSTSAGRFAVL